jgi:GNAT superfamily N-acetyltransferase
VICQTMNTIIRNCEISDFEEVFQLLLQLWPGNEVNQLQAKNVFQSGINSNNQVYLCSVYNSQIIGFCSLTIKNNLWVQGYLGHIDELIVEEQCRGKGIGSQLLKRAIEIASENHCKRIELDSGFHRIEAHEFYIKLGFENRSYLFSKIIQNDNNL